MKSYIICSILLCLADHVLVTDGQQVSYRLIEHQDPEIYILNLEFKKEVFEGTSVEYNGSLTIHFHVKRTIQSIEFHAPVSIKSLEFLVNETEPVPIESETFDTVTHIYTVTAKENLNYTYNYTLNIEFSSQINTNEMKGVFRSSYLDEDGKMQYLIATHFQPTYARFAFPCFDEPKMKATFLINITYPKGIIARSNTIQDGDTIMIDDEYEKISFKETPVMSTYLVAFILSKLTCTQGQNLTNEIPYKVCSKTEFEDERSLALEIGPLFIEKMENITALNYSDHLLGKLDQIAIPGYTHMYVENWGLVAYREQMLLWNSKESSTAYRNIVMNLFLELAHFWFGNLESADWWDYTFLNLGFSRFYQYHAAAQIDKFKIWELERQFVVDQLHPSLLLDGLSSTEPLSYSVTSPSEILTKFSTFSYIKGASLIRMVQHIIGSENFQKGVRYFLPKYNGSVIMPIYVWNQMEVFVPRELLPSTKNLNGVMDNWTENAGYPLITVTAKGTDVILTQQRFLYSQEEDFTEWCVPITYTLSEDFDRFENTTTKVWLMPGSSQTLHDVLEENDWIILNNQQIGYYRVNYDNTLWQKIKESLFANLNFIHVLNRAQIVDDLMNLARANVLDYSYVFDIIQYLKNEMEYYPWQSAITNLNYLLIKFGEDSVLGNEISAMILELLQNVYKSLSFTDVDPDDQIYIVKLLLIAKTACKLGEETCISNVKDLFASYKSGVSIDKNLRDIIYCNALRYSDDIISDWNVLWQNLQEETLQSERDIIINALGCVKDETILKNYLHESMNSSSGLNLEDLPKIWSSVYSNSPEGIDVAFDYLFENYTNLASYYSSATSILTSVIERFTKEEQLLKVKDFIALTTVESSARALAQSALKTAQENMVWVASIEDDLLSYFNIGETTTQKTETTTGGISKLEISFSKLIILILLSKISWSLIFYLK